MKSYAYTIFVIGLIIGLLFNSNLSKAGAINGINLCINIIVPALLPIIILTSTLAKSSAKQITQFPFGSIIQHIFHLPKQTSVAIIIGLIGGYPTGALLSKELFNNEEIDEEQLQRLMRFNFCGGVAFIVSAVGVSYLGSAKLGATILGINTLSSIIVGAISGLFYKDNAYYYEKNIKQLSIPNAFISSVEASTKNAVIMCCYIVFFCAVSSLVSLPSFINPILEITNGIFYSERKISFEYLCFFLEFGGLCVHLQVIGIAKTKYWDFLLYRIICSLISYFLGKIYSFFFPSTVEIFSNVSSVTPKISEVSTGFATVLLISCIVMILDLKSKKSKLI